MLSTGLRISSALPRTSRKIGRFCSQKLSRPHPTTFLHSKSQSTPFSHLAFSFYLVSLSVFLFKFEMQKVENFNEEKERKRKKSRRLGEAEREGWFGLGWLRASRLGF